jgi:hypothetical protein
MSRRCYFACAALASASLMFSAHAMPFSSQPQIARPGLTMVAGACAAGSVWHPRLHRCVSKPDCGEGAIWHPRLHRCVASRAR